MFIGFAKFETKEWFTYLKDFRANCFCASLLRTAARANSHSTSCIGGARQVLKWAMIGQMDIAIALLGLSDLGRSLTPTFLFRNRFYLQLYNNQINARALIGQSAVGYCYYKPTEKSRVF